MTLEADLPLMLRLLVALLLAGLVGLERELNRTSVGLRTHALVGVCTAAFVILAELTVQAFQGASPLLRFDPLAVLGATVSGISCLGAGAVIAGSTAERRQSLTSAASILGTSAIGLCCGLAHYPLAAALTGVILLILHGFRWVEVHVLGTRRAPPPLD